MSIAAKCLCEAIRFTFEPKDLSAVSVCHCSMCQRSSGGCGAMSLACVGPPQITEGQDYITTYKSSEWGERCFCNKCGAKLFYNAPSYGYYGVSPSLIENEQDQAKLALEDEIFIDKKPAYYSLGGGQKRLTEAEFLQRFAAKDGATGDDDDASTNKKDGNTYDPNDEREEKKQKT